MFGHKPFYFVVTVYGNWRSLVSECGEDLAQARAQFDVHLGYALDRKDSRGEVEHIELLSVLSPGPEKAEKWFRREMVPTTVHRRTTVSHSKVDAAGASIMIAAMAFAHTISDGLREAAINSGHAGGGSGGGFHHGKGDTVTRAVEDTKRIMELAEELTKPKVTEDTSVPATRPAVPQDGG